MFYYTSLEENKKNIPLMSSKTNSRYIKILNTKNYIVLEKV